MTGKWYDLTPQQIEKQLGTNLNLGLSVKSAEKRLRQYGQNEIFPVPRGSFRLYLKHILTDFTTILLAITAVISAIFEQNVGAVVIIALLMINIGAALFTYIKAQRVLESMGRYAIPNAKAVRSGQLFMLKQEQLVPGDIIYISAGDIVPCDARLIESDGLTVLEAQITGESTSVKKDASFIEYKDIPYDKRKNMIYASTVVTSGTGKAIVCDTGEDAVICSMGKNESLVSHEQLSILTDLKKYCRTVSLCMLGFILVLTILDIIMVSGNWNIADETRTLFDIFLTGLTLSVAAMSEFYAAFGYIIVGCGIFNAVKRYKDVNSGAVIRNAACLGDLRDITSIIVPKEALFAVRMSKIDRVYANNRFFDSDMRGFAKNSSQALTYAVLSTGLYGANKLVSDNLSAENVYSPEEDAIIKAAKECDIYNAGLDERYLLMDHQAVSRTNRFETSIVRFENSYVVAVRGDAQQILNCCTYYCENGRVTRMTTDKLNDLRITASQITKKAYRVIAVASKNTDYTNLTRLISCQTDLTFEGFLCIREPLLPGAAKNIAACVNSGIKVIMTTEDAVDNNRYIAAALGIVTADNQIITGAKLASMRDDMVRVNIPIYRLYQDLTIDQKRVLIALLKENGEKVGILTRELDEMILLRDADVGFAQSLTLSPKAAKGGVTIEEISSYTDRNIPVYVRNPKALARIGCEAIKFTSDVIVSEPDKNGAGGFNAIFGSICCARVIYKNLLRAARYLLTSQTARLFIVLYRVLFGIAVFEPLQLLFCGLILDFAAVIVIAFEKPSSDILFYESNTEEKLKKPLRHNLESVLFGLLWAVMTVFFPVMLNKIGFTLTNAQISSMTFIGFILTQLAVLSETKKDRSIFVSVSMNLVYTLYISFILVFILSMQMNKNFGRLFGITPATLPIILISVLLPIIMVLVYELYKYISARPPKKNKVDNLGSFFNSGFRVDDMDDDELYSTAEIKIIESSENPRVDSEENTESEK